MCIRDSINPNQIAYEELEKFQSSLREVMGCIKYSRSKEKLAAFINNNPRMNMEVAAARVIEAINHVPIRIQEGDGKFNMCEAIEEMCIRDRYIGVLGPMTDIASALMLEPAIASRIIIVWNGGNIYPNGGMEFNLVNDITAANIVLSLSLIHI